jgi:hypothetical protein
METRALGSRLDLRTVGARHALSTTASASQAFVNAKTRGGAKEDHRRRD